MSNYIWKAFNPGYIIKANAPTKTEKVTLRILIFFGLTYLALFSFWFFSSDRIGYAWLYWPLTFALILKLVKKSHEWYHYWNISVPVMPESNKTYTVDILTTFCPDEPKEMLINTLKAMQEITYPHTSYLCDEADDPELKKVCEELGVVHVTRKFKRDAKAGNINNALKQATGELCVVLDPDHVPIPEFLDRVVAYFEDPKIGYVQCVQAYNNRKESFVAMGAAEQTYHFYGPMMMCMNSYGTVQAIGANCTFRREALDSIGGHAAGLSEDMHTAMRLHAKGWKSVYVPEVLTKGLAPSTISAFYKQQLKWSRGTFDLLFHVYFKLFRKFTFNQKLHYFTLPLYFLFGVVSFIDIIVPIFSLILSETPWLVDISEFSMMVIPLFAMNLLIRQYAQRWLLERHERGFHLVGGLLRIGTWWIYTLGFIYTIFNIRVPYIPTPKDDKPENSWSLSMPNIIVFLCSAAAVVYGLQRDWSPYSFFMASFALTNSFIYGFVVIMGQQKLLMETYVKVKESTFLYAYLWLLRIYYWKTRHGIYSVLRKGSIYFAMIAVFSFLFSYTMDTTHSFELKELAPKEMKNTGGFFTGIYLPALNDTFNIEPVRKIEKSMNTSFDIVSFYQAWGPKSLEEFPMKMLQDISKGGGIPMLTWEPWSSTFPELRSNPDLSINKKICINICDGKFDEYLTQYALKIREYGDPIFIRFAHEPGNPAYPWSPIGGNTSYQYIGAWQHVVLHFEKMGVSNVTWVWNPWHAGVVYEYFPGGKYVDWIGLTALNYGKAAHDGKWRTFKEVYEPYRKSLETLKRPVMLAEFGSTTYGGDQAEWLKTAFTQIKNEYTEIKSLVYFNTERDKNWITDWRPSEHEQVIDWTIDDNPDACRDIKISMQVAPFNKRPFEKHNNTSNLLNEKANSYQSKFIKGKPGSYELIVDGKIFYIKGVAYNTAHDWRDGKSPLTRKHLSQDFKKIKEMGANLIRRYSESVYDKNIMSVANEYDLKIMYGFWFDPKVDYYKDSIKIKKYIKTVEETVERYKNDPAILAWSVGNETWGLLKHEYAKPYLSKVRQNYVRMIEHLAQRIHEIDPTRPVMTAGEHEEAQLPLEMAAYHDNAPSLDVIAINSYYIEQISQLQEVAYQYDSTRPYLVSEFGPKGYWDPDFSRLKNDTIVIEDSEFEKAILYTTQWEKYIEKNNGYNIGGIAYSWKDRLEGTATWFGLTDFKGRLKPAYHALKQNWTGHTGSSTLNNLLIEGPTDNFERGKEYTFKALTDNNLFKEKKALKYEWHLRREEYLEFVGSIKSIAGDQKVKVRIPNEASNYRLYLYVSDENNNVVTASLPMPVK